MYLVPAHVPALHRGWGRFPLVGDFPLSGSNSSPSQSGCSSSFSASLVATPPLVQSQRYTLGATPRLVYTVQVPADMNLGIIRTLYLSSGGE